MGGVGIGIGIGISISIYTGISLMQDQTNNTRVSDFSPTTQEQQVLSFGFQLTTQEIVSVFKPQSENNKIEHKC